MEKKFGVLRIVATIYKVLAWIVLVVGVLGGCLSLGMGALGFVSGAASSSAFERSLGVTGALGGMVSGVIVIFFAALYFLVLYALGETIYLLLALEENTRATAERLKEIAKV